MKWLQVAAGITPAFLSTTPTDIRSFRYPGQVVTQRTMPVSTGTVSTRLALFNGAIPALPPPQPVGPPSTVVERIVPRPAHQQGQQILSWNTNGLSRRTTGAVRSETQPPPPPWLNEAIQAYLNREPIGGGKGWTTVDPLIMSRDSDKVRYRFALSGVLVPPEGFQPQHTGQLGMGDCYWEATMAGLANFEPEVLQAMFEPAVRGARPDAWWVYYYYFDAPTQSVKRDRVLVYDSLPMKGGPNSPAYVRLAHTASGEPILWPAIAQKAFALANDKHGMIKPVAGFDGTGRGGIASDAYFWATGREQTTASWPVKEHTSVVANWLSSIQQREARLLDDIWRAVSRINGGRAVTLGTRNDSTHPELFAGHQYTVMRTRRRPQGQRIVVLRNPHGTNPEACREIPGAQHAGVLELTVEQVRDHFDLLCG